jgi:hypothetical protein
MSREVWIGLIVATCLVGGLLAYRYLHDQSESGQAMTAAAPSAAPKAPPKIQYPVPAAAAGASESPLPAMNESDNAIHSDLTQLFGALFIDSVLIPKRVIQNFVATTNSLDGPLAPLRLWPLAHVPKLPVVETSADGIVLAPDNAKRYAPYVAALKALDIQAAVKIYLHYYPLFQQAYVELGYPDRYFNDRLINVLDHLLATPQVKGPIKLIQPKVLYEYADFKLEQLSSGQKLLIRMGPDNAAIIKAKLTEFRSAIASQPAAAP